MYKMHSAAVLREGGVIFPGGELTHIILGGQLLSLSLSVLVSILIILFSNAKLVRTHTHTHTGLYFRQQAKSKHRSKICVLEALVSVANFSVIWFRKTQVHLECCVAQP